MKLTIGSSSRIFKTSVARSQARLSQQVHDIAMLPAKVHAAVFTAAMLASTSAAAQGVTGFFRGWGSAMNEIIRITLLVGMMAGIVCVLYGVIQLAKKGMNRGDDIEWKNVLWPIVGGSLATILLYVVQAVVEESGASRADIGRQR